MVSRDKLQNSSFFLAGAFYFKAPWKLAFTLSQNETPFLTSSGEKLVKMMSLTNVTLPYIKKQTFDAVSLPYADGNFSMLLVRPIQRTMDAVATLRGQLGLLNVTDIMVQLESSPNRQTAVKMPRFALEAENSLKPAMRALRINEIFAPGANFKGITHQNDLYLNDILHKVFMNVTEEGRDQLPASASEQGSPPLHFELNRPFLATIYNKFCRINLFSAFVASP